MKENVKQKYVIDDDEIMKEWNWEKNSKLNLNPNKILYYSNKKAWWKCKNGHELFEPVYRKTSRKTCPFCTNRRIMPGYNDIQTLYPELMKEWDWDANRNINPSTLSKNSEKNVAWICGKCGFKWKTAVRNRTIRNAGCHRCSLINRGNSKHKNALLKTGSLENHECLCDWDYEKNTRLPSDYSMHSNEFVYWKCHTCGYRWKGKVGNRTVLKRGCPCCANRVVVEGVNDLKTRRPDIAKEWNYSKNKIKPEQVTVGSGKKVWWICPNNHEYQATVLHRTYGDGTGCPICNSGKQTSFAEQCVYYYIKQMYPDAINRYRSKWLKNMELDIFIPSINYAIEYDGAAWHKKNISLKREKEKYLLCKKQNIKLIRLREQFAPLGSFVADYQFGGDKDLYKAKNLGFYIGEILAKLNFKTFHNPIDINIDRDRLKIQQEYLKAETKNSFADLFPNLAKEWHPTKNGNLKPNMFKPHSDFKAWWLCPECSFEYLSSIGSRSYGTGCPKCGIRKSKQSKSFKVAMYNDFGKLLNVFDSISDASRQMKISPANISAACKGKRKNAGGYSWKFVN